MVNNDPSISSETGNQCSLWVMELFGKDSENQTFGKFVRAVEKNLLIEFGEITLSLLCIEPDGYR